MNAPLKGSFTGVGIRFQIFKDAILWSEAIIEFRKSRSVAGDKIIKIENELVAGNGIKNKGVRDRLLGAKGTVQIGIVRGNNQEILDFEITRDKIPILVLMLLTWLMTIRDILSSIIFLQQV